MNQLRVLRSVLLLCGLLTAAPAAAEVEGGFSSRPSSAAALAAAGGFPAALLAALSETITYTYDARGRLVLVVRTGTVNNNVQSQYTYDAADNRTNVTVSGATASSKDPGAGASTGQPVFVVVPLNGYTLIRVNQ